MNLVERRCPIKCCYEEEKRHGVEERGTIGLKRSNLLKTTWNTIHSLKPGCVVPNPGFYIILIVVFEKAYEYLPSSTWQFLASVAEGLCKDGNISCGKMRWEAFLCISYLEVLLGWVSFTLQPSRVSGKGTQNRHPENHLLLIERGVTGPEPLPLARILLQDDLFYLSSVLLISCMWLISIM